ncbi:hypothetical protein W7U_22555 [Mycobacterium sp. H4Y]|nr:hypothetical protein W7U_22555 [Mycobacterium sp. H4Y]
MLALLLATGWVANHFVALMPVISDREHLSTATLDGIFGIYALGLLPGLLIGGRASDALGRRPMALAGAAATVAGTVAMLLSQHTGALLVGRLIVGVGVGLAISSGTAWASDLRGPAGAGTAGAVLTAGFAIGPFAGGGFAWAGQSGIQVSFAVAAAIVVLASLAVAVAATPAAHVARPAPPPDAGPTGPAAQGVSRALSWAMPLAPWVYASATLGFVTIPNAVAHRAGGPDRGGHGHPDRQRGQRCRSGPGPHAPVGATDRDRRRGSGRGRLRGGRDDATGPDARGRDTAVVDPGLRFGPVPAGGLDRSGGRGAATPAGRSDRGVLRRHVHRLRAATVVGDRRAWRLGRDPVGHGGAGVGERGRQGDAAATR